MEVSKLIWILSHILPHVDLTYQGSNTQLNKFQRISSVFDMNSLFFKNVTGNGFKKILTLRFTEDLEDLVLPRSSEDLK